MAGASAAITGCLAHHLSYHGLEVQSLTHKMGVSTVGACDIVVITQANTSANAGSFLSHAQMHRSPDLTGSMLLLQSVLQVTDFAHSLIEKLHGFVIKHNKFLLQ